MSTVKAQLDKIQHQLGAGVIGFDLAAELERARDGHEAPTVLPGAVRERHDADSILQRRLTAARERLARMRLDDERRIAA